MQIKSKIKLFSYLLFGSIIISLTQVNSFWSKTNFLTEVNSNKIIKNNNSLIFKKFNQTSEIKITNSVKNDFFNAERIWTKTLFGYKTEGANSYRIPGIVRINENNILINADKRLENVDDYNNTINQVFKISNDNGETWSLNQNIVKVTTPQTKKRTGNWWNFCKS